MPPRKRRASTVKEQPPKKPREAKVAKPDKTNTDDLPSRPKRTPMRRSSQKTGAKPNTQSTVNGDIQTRKSQTSAPEPKTRGRQPKQQTQTETANEENAVERSLDALKETSDTETARYWLMKAEPESRIEKGHDVKFSIDDLEARTKPESWDGVRNYVARNNMREMKTGDLGFFYHSNCTVPGIVGVLRIIEEASIDESAFDPDHPYYDPKSSRDKPRWDIVKVVFVKKFNEMITLKELRTLGRPGGELEDMKLLKQSRLSVSAVSPAEWRFLLRRAGEALDLGKL